MVIQLDIDPQTIPNDFFSQTSEFGREGQLCIVRQYLRQQFGASTAAFSESAFTGGRMLTESTFIVQNLALFIRPEDNSIRGFWDRYVEDEDTLVKPRPQPLSYLPTGMVPLLMSDEEVASFFNRTKSTIRLPVLTNPVGVDFSQEQIDSLEQLYSQSPYQTGTYFWVQESFQLSLTSNPTNVICQYNDETTYQLSTDLLDESFLEGLEIGKAVAFNAASMPLVLARFYGIIRSQEDAHLLGQQREEELLGEGIAPTEHLYCCHNYCGFTTVDAQGNHTPICCQKPLAEPSFDTGFYLHVQKLYGASFMNSYLMPLHIARVVFYADHTRRVIEPIDIGFWEDGEPNDY